MLLTMCFDLSLSDHYTLAVSFESGLSKYGKNIMFKINDTIVKNHKEIDDVCGNFYLLINVLFSKMSTKNFLTQNNIFRQVHCNIKY